MRSLSLRSFQTVTGLLTLLALEAGALAAGQTPAWHNIEWTEDFCIPETDGDPQSEKIANPFNLKKFGSNHALGLANLICRVEGRLLQGFPAEISKVLGKLFSHPDQRIIAELKTAMAGKRENWQHAFAMAIKVASGCTEYKYKKRKTSCERKILSEAEAAQFAQFLVEKVGMAPIKIEYLSHPSRTESYLLSALIESMHQNILKRSEGFMRGELGKIAHTMNPEIQKNWINQFFGLCDIRSEETRRTLSADSSSPTSLPVLLVRSMAYVMKIDESSVFLNSIRSLATGQVLRGCLQK